MLKKILLGLVAIIVIVLGLAALQPNEYRITRTTTFNAPVAGVFEQVNDLRKMNSWSPWTKIDPAAKHEYAGPAAGVGAQYHWSGNDDVGEGRMTLAESKPSELIRFDMEFIKPFPAPAVVTYAFQPTAEGKTVLSQTITGQTLFISKVMGLFMSMDKFIGARFEEGFANLRPIVETAQK